MGGASDTKKMRIAWVDILRFLGMTLIYWGHLGPSDNVVLYIFAHHVPLFFFISGFFAVRERKESFLSFLWRKIRSIVLPYIFFTILYYGLSLANGSLTLSSLPAALLTSAKGVRNDVPGPLWFFTCLFVVTLIYELIHRLAACIAREKGKTAVAFGLAVVVYLCGILLLGHEPAQDPAWIWNVDSACVYIFYYALGALLFPTIRKWKFAEKKISGKVCFFVFFVISILFALFMLVDGVSFTSDVSALLNASFGRILIFGLVTIADVVFEIYGLCCAVILIFMELCLARMIALMPGISRFLAYVGKDSLYHCGNELLIKYFGGLLISAAGLTVIYTNDILLLLYSILCLIVLTFTLNLLERLLLGHLFRNGAISLR
ncbi:MAG: acyltransferase family protein [Parasporobacterium sp.]|nr:acyltransferase family protein [Parasporobacterium sp.]